MLTHGNLMNPKPSQFKDCHYFYSPLSSWKREGVARNIVIMSKKNNDQWFDFSWTDYCGGKNLPDWEELGILEDFVEEGILSKSPDEKYHVTLKFFSILWRYIKN